LGDGKTFIGKTKYEEDYGGGYEASYDASKNDD